MAWRDQHREPAAPSLCRQLARQVDTLLARGKPPAYVFAALLALQDRSDAGPGLLPHLCEDAIQAGVRDLDMRAIPVTYLRDEDLDLFEVLGPDGWIPAPPPEVDTGPVDERRTWCRRASDEHRAERCAEARQVLGRRQEMRRTARQPA